MTRMIWIGAVIVVLAAAALLYFKAGPGRSRLSGEDGTVYDGYVRRSDYLSKRDGTRLAYDLLLPSRDGRPAREPLPVLFALTSYLRASQMVREGRVLHAEFFGLNWMARAYLWTAARLSGGGYVADQTKRDPWLVRMLEHGYAVVVVELSGTGASEGTVQPAFRLIAEEAREVLDWIAGQPWCNGRIGMFGKSFVGMTQYAAASTGHPGLKAIFPCSASLDMCRTLVYPGGIFNTGFNRLLSESTGILETLIVPVDSDAGGKELARILEERRKGFSLDQSSERGFRRSPYGDSPSSHPLGARLWEDMGLYTLLDAVRASGVPVYNMGGWLDIFTRDTLLWHRNLSAPRRLTVCPLDHSRIGRKGGELDFGSEARQWFDYWLKDIDTGIMDEKPVRYRVMGAPADRAWRTAETWPPPEVRPVRFYCGSDGHGKGGLIRRRPEAGEAGDEYTIDYSATTGPQSRWSAIMRPCRYPDMADNDGKALTYTTPPLSGDIEITGAPVVHVWMVGRTGDLDLFAYLEAVDERGRSSYITEGQLRASRRALAEAPYDNMGLPFHRGFQEDVQPLPEERPVEMVFDLLPTSIRIRRGRRIRLALAGADRDNFETPAVAPPPTIRVLRDARHASFVELPLAAPDPKAD